jgi:alpha-ketoglutarate-dependent taurine dioxygenase
MTDKFQVQTIKGLSADSGAADIDLAKQVLAHTGVLHLPMDHRLDKSEFEKIAELFGPIKDPIAETRDGEMYRYSERLQHIDAGYVFKEEDRDKFGEMTFGGLDDERPGLFETYHCDDTYTEYPAQLTILHARALPASRGGPTHFMDMRAAFKRLSADEQTRLRTFTVRYAYNNRNAFPPRRSASGEADKLKEVTHPLVRVHPIAATEALYMDLDRATHIEQLDIIEGRALLQRLQDDAEADAPKCQHHWQPDDVLIWDNASVQHKAGGDFKVGEQRRFWRHMIS